jgi:threonine-phosphate decarboxylase
MTLKPSILKKEGNFLAVDFPGQVVHGGCGKRQLEKTGNKVFDFSASTNPFPPRFTWSCRPEFLALYPDNSYHELKSRISRVFHRPSEEICVGNGSIEIIRVFCSVVFRERKTYYTGPHTFGEYGMSARLSGGKPAPAQKADVVFCCNPNNPTGELHSRDAMLALLGTTTARGALLFCDEAFIGLSDPVQSVADVRSPGLFVMHSLTKSFAVPGIRFGFGFGDPGLVELIETARPPWSVNAYAEAYAMEALLHLDELEASRARIEDERRHLVAGLTKLGLRCTPSAANYVVADYGNSVAQLCVCLARTGILVRDCASFGIPTSIRVAVRTREENDILLEALAACVQ